MSKDIHTLVDDIYDVVEGKGGWTEALTEYLSESISRIASERFAEEEAERNTLSLSSLGKPCALELWRRVNTPELAEPLSAEAKGTFFYGDLLEALVISLAKAAGHDVQGEQDELFVHGVKGHRDCVIDGMTVDVKSASKFSFEKFKSGKLREDDPFGYISQLSSYVYGGRDDPLVTNKSQGAFLVVSKDRFRLHLDIHDFSGELEGKQKEVEDRIQMVSGPQPDRQEPVPQSKTSPNTKLSTLCSYCSFRDACWPEARLFAYSQGPVWLVDVAKEPNVPEIKKVF